jgi:hypothetical protein
MASDIKEPRGRVYAMPDATGMEATWELTRRVTRLEARRSRH